MFSDLLIYTSNFAVHSLHSPIPTPHSTSHSTLYTLHLHFAVRTSILHSTLYTLHSTLHTPHFTPYISHSTLHTLHFPISTPLYTPHSALHTLHSKFLLNTPPFRFYTSHPTFCTLPHSTLHSLHWYDNRGRMYKTVAITCLAKVFYVTSFGFVGCFC